ncbi:DUF4367 domain-containing protein [Paenibacillus sp. Soil522]|uniref:DUF4367 domain-containing protein n=1 Tax=Paenibacillus sp. Soil522 TaxID=1736388 RepID=UPI0006FC8B0B|nr:DUF4367 domain-containing protein [Paenibacillus sp. Soil522]KRE31608.1 hypothetical protein ASG81_24960 [Paenibacillus sp. Soil522]
MINYFNTENSYVFGVRQLKNNSYITKEITEFDVKNKTQKTSKVNEKFTLEPRGELIYINGTKGWYEAYIGKKPTGGMLKWIESDTYIELDTIQLSKSSLIKIAESMKKI